MTHVRGLQFAYGDWYGRCRCGARSLPHSTMAGAVGWQCPRQQADEEVARNEARWQERVRANASPVSGSGL